MKKVYWLINGWNKNKYNGTSKELSGRNILFKNLNLNLKKIGNLNEFDSIKENILLIEYIRTIPNLKTILNSNIVYRLHHFETLHRIENLYCLIKLHIILRANNFKILIWDFIGIIKIIIKEIFGILISSRLLCVSYSDYKLLRFFTKKIEYFPYFFDERLYQNIQLEFNFEDENTRSKTITMIGAINSAPNILYNYILFHSFTKIYKNIYNFNVTGNFDKLIEISKRGKQIYKELKIYNQMPFQSVVDVSKYIFIGALYGRGVKTKIFDLINKDVYLIILTTHLHRLKNNLIEYEIISKFDNKYSIISLYNKNVNLLSNNYEINKIIFNELIND
jgi:hypothetical protein